MRARPGINGPNHFYNGFTTEAESKQSIILRFFFFNPGELFVSAHTFSVIHGDQPAVSSRRET
jgi:hypothetical protein